MAYIFNAEREKLIRLLVQLEIVDKYRQKEEERAKIQEEADKMEHESMAAALRCPILAALRQDRGWSEDMSADQLIQNSSYADIIEQSLETARQAHEYIRTNGSNGTE